MPQTAYGKLRVDFDLIPSKTHGSQAHWYEIFTVDTGRTLGKDGPFRDRTEAENAALDIIKVHKSDWEY